jgi:hypothetical protein
MCRHPEFISETHESGNELFFRYKGYPFSILKRSTDHESGPFSFYAYPKWKQSIRELAESSEKDPNAFTYITMVDYDQSDFPDLQLSELWQTVRDRHANMDDIFDAIIGHEEA